MYFYAIFFCEGYRLLISVFLFLIKKVYVCMIYTIKMHQVDFIRNGWKFIGSWKNIYSSKVPNSSPYGSCQLILTETDWDRPMNESITQKTFIFTFTILECVYFEPCTTLFFFYKKLDYRWWPRKFLLFSAVFDQKSFLSISYM